MGKQIPAAFLAALIAGLLLAGCGDGGDDGASAGNGSANADNGSANADNGSANADNGSANADNGSAGSDTSPTDSDSDSESSDDSDSTQGETIAKAEFIRKGDAICAATLGKVSREALPLLNQESKQKRETVEAKLARTVMAPALREEAEQLEELGAPAGDEGEVGAIVDAILAVSEKATKTPAAVVGSGQAFMESAALAERYGLSGCPYG